MNVLNSIWNFLLKNRLAAISILCALALFQINRYNYHRFQEAQEDAKRFEMNLKAANDEIRLTKTKDGKDEANRYAFLVESLDELKKTNSDLAKEVAKTKGEVQSIQKVGVTIQHDTIKMPARVIKNDSSITLISSFDTTYSPGNYRKGTIEHIYSPITNTATGKLLGGEIGLTAVTGIKKTGKDYEIFFRSDYPKLSITSLQGAIIKKDFFKEDFKAKQPLFTLNATVGFTPITYDFKTRKTELSVTRIGGTIGIGINLIR